MSGIICIISTLINDALLTIMGECRTYKMANIMLASFMFAAPCICDVKQTITILTAANNSVIIQDGVQGETHSDFEEMSSTLNMSYDNRDDIYKVKAY